ncbi:hypothetical protein BKA70DRAFT_1438416 [Coprinopsis sp. MPI-PUGE-AT-0042]|nr:hypothetical protein BKA70DRAFT_1438416 [Coprinopsis sp. MPI-PUGE-AT-0042]
MPSRHMARAPRIPQIAHLGNPRNAQPSLGSLREGNLRLAAFLPSTTSFPPSSFPSSSRSFRILRGHLAARAGDVFEDDEHQLRWPATNDGNDNRDVGEAGHSNANASQRRAADVFAPQPTAYRTVGHTSRSPTCSKTASFEVTASATVSRPPFLVERSSPPTRCLQSAPRHPHTLHVARHLNGPSSSARTSPPVIPPHTPCHPAMSITNRPSLSALHLYPRHPPPGTTSSPHAPRHPSTARHGAPAQYAPLRTRHITRRRPLVERTRVPRHPRTRHVAHHLNRQPPLVERPHLRTRRPPTRYVIRRLRGVERPHSPRHVIPARAMSPPDCPSSSAQRVPRHPRTRHVTRHLNSSSVQRVPRHPCTHHVTPPSQPPLVKRPHLHTRHPHNALRHLPTTTLSISHVTDNACVEHTSLPNPSHVPPDTCRLLAPSVLERRPPPTLPLRSVPRGEGEDVSDEMFLTSPLLVAMPSLVGLLMLPFKEGTNELYGATHRYVIQLSGPGEGRSLSRPAETQPSTEGAFDFGRSSPPRPASQAGSYSSARDRYATDIPASRQHTPRTSGHRSASSSEGQRSQSPEIRGTPMPVDSGHDYLEDDRSKRLQMPSATVARWIRSMADSNLDFVLDTSGLQEAMTELNAAAAALNQEDGDETVRFPPSSLLPLLLPPPGRQQPLPPPAPQQTRSLRGQSFPYQRLNPRGPPPKVNLATKPTHSTPYSFASAARKGKNAVPQPSRAVRTSPAPALEAAAPPEQTRPKKANLPLSTPPLDQRAAGPGQQCPTRGRSMLSRSRYGPCLRRVVDVHQRGGERE